jgi:hypothetical protein
MMADQNDDWLRAERERFGRPVTEDDIRAANDMMLDAMLAARKTERLSDSHNTP